MPDNRAATTKLRQLSTERLVQLRREVSAQLASQRQTLAALGDLGERIEMVLDERADDERARLARRMRVAAKGATPGSSTASRHPVTPPAHVRPLVASSKRA
jgi:hypothetical protein